MNQHMTATHASVPSDMALDAAYHALEQAIALRVAENRAPLFTTTADPEQLWTLYLMSFPAENQRYYTCQACRQFIERFGGLVVIDETGRTMPLLWHNLDVPELVQPIVATLNAAVIRNRVDGVFRWPKDPWGIPSNVSKKTGATWTHLHGLPGVHHEKRDQTPGQQMAAFKEDVGILNRSIEDYSLAAVEEAVRVLQSGTLTRSEKAEGVATWFLELHRALVTYPKARRNLIWRAVATAPWGFAHVRTTVLSTLLDDIVAGLPFAEVSRRWAEKLHPLQYQRPQAPATAGQIDAAERKVKTLGIERSLLRRFATLDDVLAKVWEPRIVPQSPGRAGAGVFDGLRQESSAVKALELPRQVVTWEKFRRTALLDANRIDLLVPPSGAFYGLVTAVDPDAPAIIQWDGLEGHARNPVSWYFYAHGSSASQWGLTAEWTPVSAIFLPPFQWQEPARFAHHGLNVFFALPAARDRNRSGLMLFPEILRAELREIRAVIEAHSNRMELELPDNELGTANGLALGKGERSPVTLRITSANGTATYTIDRFE